MSFDENDAFDFGLLSQIRGGASPISRSPPRTTQRQINAAGQRIVQRQINSQPTITCGLASAVNVLVTKDMLLEPYQD